MHGDKSKSWLDPRKGNMFRKSIIIRKTSFALICFFSSSLTFSHAHGLASLAPPKFEVAVIVCCSPQNRTGSKKQNLIKLANRRANMNNFVSFVLLAGATYAGATFARRMLSNSTSNSTRKAEQEQQHEKDGEDSQKPTSTVQEASDNNLTCGHASATRVNVNNSSKGPGTQNEDKVLSNAQSQSYSTCAKNQSFVTNSDNDSSKLCFKHHDIEQAVLSAVNDAINICVGAEQATECDRPVRPQTKTASPANATSNAAEESANCDQVRVDANGGNYFFSPSEDSDGESGSSSLTFVTEVTCCESSSRSSSVTREATQSNVENEAESDCSAIELPLFHSSTNNNSASEIERSSHLHELTGSDCKTVTELLAEKKPSGEPSLETEVACAQPDVIMETYGVLRNVENYERFSNALGVTPDCGLSVSAYETVLNEEVIETDASDLSNYDEQLLAMEEEMKRNKEEIEMCGDTGDSQVGFDDTESYCTEPSSVSLHSDIAAFDDCEIDDAEIAPVPTPMATILEEDEDAESLQSACNDIEQAKECQKSVSDDEIGDSSTFQTPLVATQNEAKTFDDNSATTSSDEAAKQCVTAHVNEEDGSSSRGPSIESCTAVSKNTSTIVTKADVHAENTDLIQTASDITETGCSSERDIASTAVTSCEIFVPGNESINHGGDICRNNKTHETGSAGLSTAVVTTSVLSVGGVMTADEESTTFSATEMGQQSTESTIANSGVPNAEELHKRPFREDRKSDDGKADFNDVVSVKVNSEEAEQQQQLPSNTVKLGNTGAPSENRSDGHGGNVTITSNSDWTHLSEKVKLMESSNDENLAKDRSSSIDFFGTRPKNTTPTLCSLSAKIRCVNDNASKANELTVADKSGSCKLEIYLKDLEGLSIDRTKVYVKVILQTTDGKLKRKKKKTKVVSCSSLLQWKKQIGIRNISTSLLTEGRLTATVWSSSLIGSNKSLCKCDVEMAKQMRFSEGIEGVMSFGQRLLQQGATWSEVVLYMS